MTNFPKIEEIFRNRKKNPLPVKNLTKAAVLFPLFNTTGSLQVLFTKRSRQVAYHKGEISFPGGRMDAGDKSLLDCALRETYEEIGLELNRVRIFGELDEIDTVATDFRITTFVGEIPYPYNFVINRHEIEEIIMVPLHVFFDNYKNQRGTILIRGEPIEVYYYHWGNHTIWGATAWIINKFIEMFRSDSSEIGK